MNQQIHKGADHLEITAVTRKLGHTLQSSEDATGVAAMYRRVLVLEMQQLIHKGTDNPDLVPTLVNSR